MPNQKHMPQAITGEDLRAIMRRVPSPVTVVTATDGEQARGITIGSFTSVSLEPPLISFNVMQDSSMAPVLHAARECAVHILTDAQAHLSNHFAVPDQPAEAQWAAVEHTTNGRGTPLLPDVVGILFCEPAAFHEAGDHFIVVAEVVGVQAGEPGAEPLLYYFRSYREVGEEVSSLPLLSKADVSDSGSP